MSKIILSRTIDNLHRISPNDGIIFSIPLQVIKEDITYTIKFGTQYIYNIPYIPKGILDIINILELPRHDILGYELFNGLLQLFSQDLTPPEFSKIKECQKKIKEYPTEIQKYKNKIEEYKTKIEEIKQNKELDKLENIKEIGDKNNKQILKMINIEKQKNIVLNNKLNEITILYETLIKETIN